jgi:hypothetical protein
MAPMRRLLVTLVPLVLLACSKEEPPDAREAAVKVEVSFNFKAGCIKVRAVDAENSGAEGLEDSALVWTREATNRVVTVAVFRQDSWSRVLNITATAHERSPEDAEDKPCAGAVVATDNRQIALDRAGVRELKLALSATDEDGDGYIAPSGGGTDCDDSTRTGAQRFPRNEEVCDELDNNCLGNVDEGFNKIWYRDRDGDGAQDEASVVTRCGSPGADYGNRNSAPFDCADNDPARTPGKTELCDGVDNNCAGGVDEPFTNKGQPCSNDVCGGQFICNPAQDGTVCNAPAPVSYYPDVDRDGEGAVGSTGTKICAPAMPSSGTVANATDCDDVDPGTRVGAAEVCDGLDNNCNTQLDENLSCGGVFRRVYDDALGGTGHDWRTVAVGPNGYPVWVAGVNGKLVRRTSANTPFESHSFGEVPANTTNCGDFDWYAAWVRPSDGHVFLAGEGGRVARHTGTECIDQDDAPGTANAVGMIGFETGTGTTLYLVRDDGKLFTWVPGSEPFERHNAGGVYKDIHALDPNLLLVAGGQGGGSGNQLIAAYANGTLTARSLHTLNASARGNANAVWMGAANLAYAVGDGGRVWRWNGATNWSLVTTPPVPTVDFTSVVMQPGGDVAYMVDRGNPGGLRRLTQYGWARAPLVNPGIDLDVPLYDIAMTSTGGRLEYWMVGDDGRVYHYPE